MNCEEKNFSEGKSKCMEPSHFCFYQSGQTETVGSNLSRGMEPEASSSVTGLRETWGRAQPTPQWEQ